MRLGVEIARRAQALPQYLDRTGVLAVQARDDTVLAAPQKRAEEQFVVGVHAELAIGEEQLDPPHAVTGERGERRFVERGGLVHRGERVDAAGRVRRQSTPALAGVLHALAGLG